MTKQWDSVEIMSKHNAPRSYIVRNANGKILRRNRRHIRSSKTPLEYNNIYDDEINGDRSEKLSMPIISYDNKPNVLPNATTQGSKLEASS